MKRTCIESIPQEVSTCLFMYSSVQNYVWMDVQQVNKCRHTCPNTVQILHRGIHINKTVYVCVCVCLFVMVCMVYVHCVKSAEQCASGWYWIPTNTIAWLHCEQTSAANSENSFPVYGIKLKPNKPNKYQSDQKKMNSWKYIIIRLSRQRPSLCRNDLMYSFTFLNCPRSYLIT